VVAVFHFQLCAHRDKQTKITRINWWKLKGGIGEVFKEKAIKVGNCNEEDGADNMCVKMAPCI
jgi:hypothetical protein